MRLNKFIAHCGIANRRQASELVKNGRIKVNNEVVTESFYQIQKGDKVEYNGAIIQPKKRLVYVLMNKPKNVVVANKDKGSRTSVLDIIGQKGTTRLIPLGEMKKESIGLLLITNDKELAEKLNSPNKKVQQMHQVVLDKEVSEKHLEQIAEGPVLKDGKATVNKVFYTSEKDKKGITIEMHTGRSLIIRRIFEHFGYNIKGLDRIYYGGLTKKDLPRGQFRFLSEREIIMLKHFL